MKPRPKDVIKQAACAFDAELHTRAYSTTHADSAQLDRLLSFLPTKDNQVLLDLATGAGYVAMELARRYPQASVVGLDIAEGAIAKNIELAEQMKLRNIRFSVFDGITLPFEANRFSAVFCRYGLHHFPLLHTTLAEIDRTLQKTGKVIIADAVKSGSDDSDFINKFQHLKRDGHVRMYAKGELVRIFKRYGLLLEEVFESSLTFTRASTDEYEQLISTTCTPALAAYDLSTANGFIQLTLPIFNGVFVRQSA